MTSFSYFQSMARRNKLLGARNATDPNSWFDRVELNGHQPPLQTSAGPWHRAPSMRLHSSQRLKLKSMTLLNVLPCFRARSR